MQDNFITILQSYEKQYQGFFLEVFCPKLGLKTCEQKEDLRLLALLLDAMERKGADFTQTFRYVSLVRSHNCPSGILYLKQI